MITAADFRHVVKELGVQAYDDIEWANNCRPPKHAVDFAQEAIFVICNSGMKNTVARGIYNRVRVALLNGHSSSTVFGHKGKCAAIDDIWKRRRKWLRDYTAAADKVEFCATIPWIGHITKYHLAKNFGAQVAKPDVHLERLATREGVTAQALCERLAKATGHKVPAIDTVLWRACAVVPWVINSRTGEIRGRR